MKIALEVGVKCSSDSQRLALLVESSMVDQTCEGDRPSEFAGGGSRTMPLMYDVSIDEESPEEVGRVR